MRPVVAPRRILHRLSRRLSPAFWHTESHTKRPVARAADLDCFSAGRKRQQGDVPGLLDGAGQAALVRGANAGQPAGHNLAALGHKALQQAHIAVGDRVDLLGAELANLLAAEKLAAAAGAAAGTSALTWSARAAGARPGTAVSLLVRRSSGAFPCTSSAMMFPLQLS